MAETNTVQVNLRLPDTLFEQLTIASEKAGVPKNRIFNDAVTAVTEGYDGRCEKPKYVHTCVRLPGEMHDAVRSIAIGDFTTINAKLVQILANHLGVEQCPVVEVESV